MFIFYVIIVIGVLTALLCNVYCIFVAVGKDINDSERKYVARASSISALALAASLVAMAASTYVGKPVVVTKQLISVHDTLSNYDTVYLAKAYGYTKSLLAKTATLAKHNSNAFLDSVNAQ